MRQASKILIVGGNAAGPAAAAKAKRVSPESEIILFEQSDFISTGTCELPYVLSGIIEDYKKIVFFNDESFKEEKGVQVYINHRVEDINRHDKYLFVRNLKDNKTYKFDYDKLILTTGSSTLIPPELTGTYRNVFPLKSVSDLLRIKDSLQKAIFKRVCIIGSGYIGIETAEAFNEIGYEVILLEKAEDPFPSASEEIKKYVTNILINNKIEFYGGVSRINFISQEGEIKSIKIDGRKIDIDLIILAAGFRPNNRLALKTGLEIEHSGALKVNNKLQTSDNNIFAAGDNIQVINFVTKRSDYIPLATIAHKTGHIAGANAAGGNSFINPIVKNISVKIFNKYYTCCGITEEEAKEKRIVYSTISSSAPNIIKVMPQSTDVFGKILYEKYNKRILGAEFFGGKEVSGYSDMISMMIRNSIQVTTLSETEFNYTPPLSPFINLLSILGKKAKSIN